MKARLIPALVGLGLGFTLSRAGFSSWDEVNAMLALRDLRLIFVFGAAVALLAITWAVIDRVAAPRWPTRLIHRGTLAGGVLFGAGWAVSGACPGVVPVQLGEMQFGAVLTLVGIFAGNWLYSVVHERYFRWAAASCAED